MPEPSHIDLPSVHTLSPRPDAPGTVPQAGGAGLLGAAGWEGRPPRPSPVEEPCRRSGVVDGRRVTVRGGLPDAGWELTYAGLVLRRAGPVPLY
ncbi:hypothetical protein GCM10009663_31700 [Kitasatospora arboriphila]|uniref:Uncharacterized protein n=1 Tax=Kitasatospora arboriphila TaxID=258052 RepID=A0ABN1THE0_9ACTN